MSNVTRDHFRSQNVAQGRSLKPVSVSITVVGNNLDSQQIHLKGQMSVELLDVDGNVIITTQEQSVNTRWPSSGQLNMLRVRGTRRLDLSKSYAMQIRITMQYMALDFGGSILTKHKSAAYKATFNGPVRLLVVRNGQTETHATPNLSSSQHYFDLNSQYAQTKTVSFATGAFLLGEDVTSLTLEVNFNIILP